MRTYAAAGFPSSCSIRKPRPLRVFKTHLRIAFFVLSCRSRRASIIKQGDGMSFPKRGKLFPPASPSEQSGYRRVDSQIFAAVVASALNDALGQTTAHVKIVASWTGANERTVK